MTDEQKAQKMAEKMGKNASKEDIDNVAENLDSMNKGPLAEVWDKIQAMWNAFSLLQHRHILKQLLSADSFMW